MSDRVVIIGVGMMGPGIGAISALAGNTTTLVHHDPRRAAEGVEKARAAIRQLVEGGLVDRESEERAKLLLHHETRLEAVVPDASLIVEAISEKLDAKQELFGTLDRLASPNALIVSNTSGLRITEIAALTQHPERTATTHFWFPAHLVPLVEVVMGEKTDPKTAESLRAILARWGKSPVVVKKDLPGQLANRILQAVIREAVNIVASGLASPEDVDTAIKAGMAVRFPVWGPLEHIDAVGLDLALAVQRSVLPGLNNDPHPPELLEALCTQGNLGFKTGRGIYDWSEKSMAKLAARRDAFIIGAVRLIGSLPA